MKDYINFFKNSTVCVEPFRAIKKVNDSLNQTRKRIMYSYATDELKQSIEYKLLKSRYYILLTNKDDLEDIEYKYDSILKYHVTEREILDRILEIDTTLEKAYKIKEEYIVFNDETPEPFEPFEKKERELDSLIKRMKTSNTTEMIDCAQTLANWKKEITNTFRWVDIRRLSNGPIEWKNNYIKKIINNANGLSNFERSRTNLYTHKICMNHSQ